MKLDISRFKKIKDEPTHAVLRHEDGHEIRVHKGALKPAMQKQLAALPIHFDEGGEVPGAMGPTGSPDMAQEPPPPMGGSGASGSWDAPSSSYSELAPQSSAPAPAAPVATQQAPDPFGTGAYSDAYLKGIGEQRSGALGEAAATGQLAKEQEAVLVKQVEQQQKAQELYQQHWDEQNSERRAAIQDVQNDHIDPQHYWNSKDTGGKVSTAVGLILGGLGAGLTGGENMALKFLNAQIDRDIEGQKANLGKKENLLSANMRHFGNIRDASDMTRLMQADIIKNQLSVAAAKASDPQAKARALQAVGQIDAASAPVQAQLASRRAMSSGIQGGHIDPSVAVRAVVPEAHQAAAYKELQDAQNAVALRDDTLHAFDQVAELNTVSNRLGSPIQSSRQIDAVRGAALDKLTKDTSGRVTPETVKLIEGLFSRMGNSKETVGIARSRMNSMLSQNMHYPLLQSYGINPAQSARFGSNGQSRIQESAPVTKK